MCKLEGKVDKETLLALLPFIDNPKEVLEKLKAEAEADKANNDPYSDRNVELDGTTPFPNLNAITEAHRGSQSGFMVEGKESITTEDSGAQNS